MSEGRVLDLDAARAARAEVEEAPPVVRLEGQTFELPRELPIDFAFRHREGDLRGALGMLFGDSADRFFALRPSVADIEELAAGVLKMYGLSPGEAKASGSSSPSGGATSRPTSSGSTPSTSEPSPVSVGS